MEIPVFISTPQGFLSKQEKFFRDVEETLKSNDLRPMTLGRTEYSIDAPLKAIRRIMACSFGLLALAFRRTFVSAGTDRPNSDLGWAPSDRSGSWLTSPYCHIEPAMAYQIGLPIIVWREKGVSAEGVLEKGVTGLMMPEFDLDNPPDLTQQEWSQPLQTWIGRVRHTYDQAGEVRERW